MKFRMAPVKAGAIFGSGLVGLLGGAVGALMVFYIRSIWPTHINGPDATIFTGVLGSGVGLLAVIIAVWGVVSARAIARRQTTLAHLAGLEADASIQEAQREFNKLVRAGGMAGFADKDKEGSTETQSIVTVLNVFELISIGIQRGIIDPELYRRWYHSQVILTWKNAQPFIVALRARVDRPTLYHEFEEMARWMNQNRIPHRRFWWTGIV